LPSAGGGDAIRDAAAAARLSPFQFIRRFKGSSDRRRISSASPRRSTPVACLEALAG